MNKKGESKSAYKEAGIDIDAATKAVDLMKPHIRSTFNERVVGDIGHFGGMIDASFLKKMAHPILVWSIDGVGTKMMIAEEMNEFTVGQCIVNHCVNDILSQGAIPIAFMDYVASAKLKPETMEKIIAEIAVACKAIKLPLIAGETAEMPGVYHEGRHDLVGATVGFVEKDKIIDGSKIEEGDILIGLPSNGLHTNGFSLARKAFFETISCNEKTYFSDFNCTIGEEFLKIHKCYFQSVIPIIQNDIIGIHGIAHITGGGFFDNIGRLLKKGLCAEITQEWRVPSVFNIIQKAEKVSDEEMRRVFNLGIGMVLIVPFRQNKLARITLKRYGEPNHVILGTIRKARSSDKGNVVFTY